jgi:hypothetical protein
VHQQNHKTEDKEGNEDCRAGAPPGDLFSEESVESNAIAMFVAARPLTRKLNA